MRMHFLRSLGLPLVLLGGGLVTAACSGGTADVNAPPEAGVPGVPDPQTPEAGTDGAVPPSDAGTDAAACATAEANTVKPPVDFVFSVDQSGSMSDEVAALTQNINGLADLLSKSGIDYRLVMIAGKPGNGALPVCVPAPLGGPNCATNDPIFRAVDQHIESWDSLKLIIDTYKTTGGPKAWADVLRPNALKVFVPITDDSSVDMTAQAFDAALLQLGGNQFGDETKRKYVVYPIIGASAFPDETRCGSNAVTNGPEYIQLAKLTGGKWFSICNPSFKSVFDEIGKTVNAGIACEVGIPTVEGQTLDPARVNVKIEDKSGKTIVELKQGCTSPLGSPVDGWEYSEDKKKIRLCNSACDQVGKNPDLKTVVEFGCMTKKQ